MADPGVRTVKRGTVIESPRGSAEEFARVISEIGTTVAPVSTASVDDAKAFLNMKGDLFLGMSYSGFDANVIRSESITRLGYFTSIAIGVLVAQNGTKRLREREVPSQNPDGSVVKKQIGQLGLTNEKSIVGQQMEKTTLTASRIMHAFVYEVTIALSKMPNTFKRIGESRVPASCQHAAVASLPWDEGSKSEVKEFAKTFSFLINQLREKDRDKSIKANFSEQIFEQQWASRHNIAVPDVIKNQITLICRAM